MSTPLERSSNTLGGKLDNSTVIGIDSNCSGCEIFSGGSGVEVEASIYV